MNASEILCIISSAIIAYLLGSINFAIIITRAFIHDDIRKHGSGNAGFTNVLRTVGTGPAVLTLLGDFLKGILSVLILRFLLFICQSDSQLALVLGEYFVIYAALSGHVFPIYYNFKGGKGILVSFGAMLILSPFSGLVCLIGFLIATSITKYVSFGSIIAAILFPISILILALTTQNTSMYEVLLTLPVSLLVIYMHRANIKRLLNHSEHKISFKKKAE